MKLEELGWAPDLAAAFRPEGCLPARILVSWAREARVHLSDPRLVLGMMQDIQKAKMEYEAAKAAERPRESKPIIVVAR